LEKFLHQILYQLILNIMLIEELIKKNENKVLEFKENTKNLSSIIKAVVAFANTAGGTIIIGIEDRTKKLIGVKNSLDEEERLINAISDSISPFIIPNIEIHSYKNKELLIINIPHSAGPYYIKSLGIDKGAFIRSGSTNRIADSEMLDTLKLYAKKITFDEIAYPMGDIEDLDWIAIKESFRESNKRITESKAEDLELVVNHIGKLCPSMGGIILFGKKRLKLFPDALIRCVRFAGYNKSKVIDHLEIDDYPVYAVQEVIKFIERNTKMGVKFNKIKRIDIPEYPPIAIRETVINAVVHTDYTIKGSSVLISIFDDRIEITNPGGIPIGITLERALSGASRIRNRVIAKTFRELGLIEQWGSGLQRIIHSCNKKGLKKPLFEDFISEFMVTLYATKEKRLNKSGKK